MKRRNISLNYSKTKINKTNKNSVVTDDNGETKNVSESSSTTTTQIQEQSTRQRASKLSAFFTCTGDRDVKTGQCLLCKKQSKSVIIKMTGGNTSGLKRHLKSTHKSEYVSIYDSKTDNQPCIDEIFTNSSNNVPLDAKLFKQSIFEEKVIDWLTIKYLPFNFFEDMATVNLFSYLNKKATLPKRHAVRNKVLSRFKNMQQGFMKTLQNIPSKISLTVDGWTSVSNQSYYGITAHFINNWELVSVVFDFVPSNGLHSGKDIAILLYKVLSNYNLNSKVQAITVDNAAANTTFIIEFSNLLKDINIDFDPLDQHFRCFGHILNLGVQDLMKTLNIEYEDSDSESDSDTSEMENEELNDEGTSVIGKLRKLVIKLKYSEQLKNKFKSCCDSCNLQLSIPPSDVKTRWNSTYDMINGAVKLKPALDLLCNKNPELKNYLITHDEWSILTGVSLFLRNFKALTLILGGDNYVTLPLVVIGFNMLVDKIEKNIFELNDKEDRSKVDEILLLAYQASRDKILKHYKKCNWVYCAVLILDPRHKLESFELTSWGQELLAASREKFELMYKQKYYIPTEKIEPAKSQINENDLDDDIIDVRSLFSSKNTLNYNEPGNDEWKKELNAYYLGPKATKEDDILQWWCLNENSYPNLARMAKDLLSIPATSVPAERLFSRASLTIRKHRNKLNAESARALLCLNSWCNSKLKNVFVNNSSS